MTALPFRTGWGEVHPVTASYGLSRLERLGRLHRLALDSELAADPCTPERAARANRVAQAYREEATHAVQTEPCGVCGAPGRVETGLCERCQESHDHTQAQDYAFWVVSA